MRWLMLIALLGVLTPLGGCETAGSAQVIRRSRQGGVLALKGNRAKAMKDARRRMRKACNGPYVIVEESNDVVGRDFDEKAEDELVYRNGRYVRRPKSRYEEREVREYRITYECGEGADGIDVSSEEEPRKRTKRRAEEGETKNEEEVATQPGPAEEPAAEAAGEGAEPDGADAANAEGVERAAGPPDGDDDAAVARRDSEKSRQPEEPRLDKPRRTRRAARAAQPPADLYEGTSRSPLSNRQLSVGLVLASFTAGACGLQACLMCCVTGFLGYVLADDPSNSGVLAFTVAGSLTTLLSLVGAVAALGVTGAVHYLLMSGVELVQAEQPEAVPEEKPPIEALDETGGDGPVLREGQDAPAEPTGSPAAY